MGEWGFSCPISPFWRRLRIFRYVDDLVHANAAERSGGNAKEKRERERSNRLIILCLTVSVVFLIATLVFVYLKLKANITYWQAFVWAVPVSCLSLLWSNR
ncbi:MAG: hypothetical protein ACLS4Z_09020 [Christensenellaceae bacterium]